MLIFFNFMHCKQNSRRIDRERKEYRRGNGKDRERKEAVSTTSRERTGWHQCAKTHLYNIIGSLKNVFFSEALDQLWIAWNVLTVPLLWHTKDNNCCQLAGKIKIISAELLCCSLLPEHYVKAKEWICWYCNFVIPKQLYVSFKQIKRSLDSCIGHFR